MRELLVLLIVVSFSVSVLSVLAGADSARTYKTTTNGQYQYYVEEYGDGRDDGEAILVKYLGEAKKIVIPAMIDEYNVCTTADFWKSATSVETVVYKAGEGQGANHSHALESSFYMSYAPKLKDIEFEGEPDFEDGTYRWHDIYNHCLYGVSCEEASAWWTEYLLAVPGGLEEITLKANTSDMNDDLLLGKCCNGRGPMMEVSSSLKRINVDTTSEQNHQGYWSLNGLLMQDDSLITVPGAYSKDKTLVLPKGIKTSYGNAFPNYNEVIFPDGLESFYADEIIIKKPAKGAVPDRESVVLDYPAILRFPKTLKEISGSDFEISYGYYEGQYSEKYSNIKSEVKDLYFDMTKSEAETSIECIDHIYVPKADDAGIKKLSLNSFCRKYFPNAKLHFKEEIIAPSESPNPSPSMEPVPSPSVSIKPQPSPEMTVYSDVPTSGKWYSEAVYHATAKGYMAGTGNNKFSPDATVTRGTIAQILYAAEGKPAISGKSKFTDVGEAKWYAKAVKWAADKGLVSGYGNGKFGPEDRITREQMVAIMMQYSKMKGYDTSANADLSKFHDQNTISKWAVNAVKWGVFHKIVSGTDKGIEPKGNATRAQIAVILQAYDKNLRKQ